MIPHNQLENTRLISTDISLSYSKYEFVIYERQEGDLSDHFDTQTGVRCDFTGTDTISRIEMD